jgi:hypothetical protein
MATDTDSTVWVKSYTCLPRVAIEADGDLGAVQLVSLAFEQWAALEGQSTSAAYDKLHSKYRRNPPVFCRKDLQVPARVVVEPSEEHSKELKTILAGEIARINLALHWYSGVAPVDPRHSVTYFDPRSDENERRFAGLAAHIADEGVPRIYGESEKEYATENPAPTVMIRAADVAPLAAMLAFVERTEPVWAARDFAIALESLASLAVEGMGWPVRIVLLVGACEGLLIPDRRSGLERAFTTRLASLPARDHADVDRWMTWLQPAYAVRSDVVHGRELAAIGDGGSPEQYVLALQRAVIVAACRLVAYRAERGEGDAASDPLWALLDDAPSSPTAFDKLVAHLGDARTRQAHQFTA